MAGAHLSGVMGKGERANQVRQAYRIVARDKERFSHSQPCAKKERNLLWRIYIPSFSLSFTICVQRHQTKYVLPARPPFSIISQCSAEAAAAVAY